MPVDDESSTITLSTEVPAALFEELHALVVNGWSRDLDDLVLDALRRYVESHRESLVEELVREDIDRGLHGGD
ncbi:MAG TPA: CopG family transcriptional regulator [Thermoanaerobaculia bacterium]|nr:CopG family transcriptional regulator [Thermoanaerobaculia bacterium]